MTSPRLIDVIKAAVARAKLDAHPVGSLYWSREATDPAELFGGVWQRVKDKFILAAGDSYAAGGDGGSTSHAHTTQAHTLTVAEMPRHGHNVVWWDNQGTVANAKRWTNDGATYGADAAAGGLQPNGITWHDGVPKAAQSGNGDPCGRTDHAGAGGGAYARRHGKRVFDAALCNLLLLGAN